MKEEMAFGIIVLLLVLAGIVYATGGASGGCMSASGACIAGACPMG